MLFRSTESHGAVFRGSPARWITAPTSATASRTARSSVMSATYRSASVTPFGTFAAGRGSRSRSRQS